LQSFLFLFVVRLTVVLGGDLDAEAALPGVRLRGFSQPRQIWSSRSTTSASNCTISEPRSDCSSWIVLAPTIVVETPGLRNSQPSATSTGFHARVDCGVHDHEAARLVYGVAEVHGPRADPADQQT
jgi:hypothetical protein